jgi:ribonuclease HII
VAAAVVLPQDSGAVDALRGVRDSKALTQQVRERLYVKIGETAVAVGLGWATSQEIDDSGIVAATRLAMQRAVFDLKVTPQALIIDALTLPCIPTLQMAYPYADAKSLSVAAASIIAKVSRDRWMERVADAVYPGYGFADHKGYGSRAHQAALDRLGVCALHRRSFRPIALRCGPGGQPMV